MPNKKDAQTGKQKPKWHHFDLGNSSTGPVGIAGNLVATSKDEATRRLIDLLPEEVDLTGSLNSETEFIGEYIRLYINPSKIARSAFNDVEELSADEYERAMELKKAGRL